MADNTPVTTEREEVRNRDLNNPLRYETTDEPSGVNVYDRPATTAATPRSSNVFSTILVILVILVLAYFVFQWLF